MPIENIDNIFFIPPVFRLDNRQDLLQSRRGLPFFKEKHAQREMEPDRQIEITQSGSDAGETVAAPAQTTESAPWQDSTDPKQSAIDAEQAQLTLMQNVIADAQHHLTQETSAARIAEILKDMVDSIQRLLDAKKESDAEARFAQMPDATQETLFNHRTAGVDNGFLSAEDILKWHRESLGWYDQKSAEAAYHEVLQPQALRPDGAPVVPPLHHEDEYL
ncbi:MAG: hypothetical protein JXX14_08390 [Deltaproteobacteria bacterium]|nr:hypothetical protein [Deltaproteobacteria bacterium]